MSGALTTSGSVAQVEPRNRIERVEVRPHDVAEVGRRELADVDEGVHRAAPDGGADRRVGHLPTRDLHRHQRIQVRVQLETDVVCVELLIHELLLFGYELGDRRPEVPTRTTGGRDLR